MDDIRALTSKLGEAVLDEPLSCCCVPYQQNVPAARAPRDCATPGRRLPLYATGQRIMGQLYVNLELYPGPARPVPQMKAELRGGKHYPVCNCVKRNGLQDSCLSWRCMLANTMQGAAGQDKGCAALPFPQCVLGRKQLSKYATLPDRTPEYCRYDYPPACCKPCTPT
ncbi:uncharacterized protein LOC113209749 isoform X2 [Frankliniella occidentalis]|uniref:Uncharacterized protein LOC113209749 isoform X2 n=1 Tax=Frankliniella occidentalis TaxID=133901 RepID=A0A6J1SQW7_FRAOC|nr:uncharacterized protein LOC113209749 isoform X2 [Frankliniella occidentalis]XP_052125708.1 uncharacterized protein LOC113209749 isoform X2 [Frankliniella occidentalis]